MYNVEVRTEAGWGHFLPQHFSTRAAAIKIARAISVGNTNTGSFATRVCRLGGSPRGDTLVWDSRENS